MPEAWRAWAVHPPARAPKAVAKAPVRRYQANAPVRLPSGNTWDRAACSMARKGPTSLPEGLMTPKVAASTRTVKSRLRAKGPPAATMSAAPRMSMRLRPRRSA